LLCAILNLNLLTWRIWWAPNNASKWQMGFNLAFKVLNNLWNEGYVLKLYVYIIYCFYVKKNIFQ
jgi:hypothetical protein